MNFITEKFIEYYKANPVQTSFNLLLSVTFSIDDLLVPYLTGKIVNAVQDNKPWIKSLIILIIVIIGMQCLYSFASWHDAIVLPSMQNFLKHEMLSNIITKFQFTHAEPIVGEIMSRIIKIPLTISYLYEQFRNYIVTYFFTLVITSLYIMTLDFKMGCVIFLCIILVFAIIVFAPLKCMKETAEQDQSLSKIDDESEDLLRNLPSIYVSNQIKPELERIKQFENNYEKKYMSTMKCAIKTRIIGIAILGIMMIYIAYRSYYGIKNKTLKVGAFVAIFLIVMNWFSTLGWLVSNIKDMIMNWGIIDAYSQMVDKQTDPVEPKEKLIVSDISIPNTGIVLYNLTYKIKSKVILKDINFYLPPNERLTIMGEIGSGKSTLLKLLLGLYQPTSGEIYIDGVAISDMSKETLRKTIMYVPQHPVLFNRSIYENIVYGISDKPSIENIKALIKDLGIEDAFDLDASAGRNGSALSGGTKQLIAIMRAILVNPKIIALDEITSSIDAGTKEKLFNLLDRLLKNKTVIIVTHDESLLKFATVKCNMVNGKLEC